VTGSVAERVAPSCSAIGRDSADRDSRPILVHSQTRTLEFREVEGVWEVPDYDGGDECSGKCEGEDTPDIAEEVGLISARPREGT
jgi:hypothetical protein